MLPGYLHISWIPFALTSVVVSKPSDCQCTAIAAAIMGKEAQVEFVDITNVHAKVDGARKCDARCPCPSGDSHNGAPSV